MGEVDNPASYSEGIYRLNAKKSSQRRLQSTHNEFKWELCLFEYRESNIALGIAWLASSCALKEQLAFAHVLGK